MSIPRLIWISLLTSGIAAADQGPLADRGDWALGVALPSSGGSSFSLWKIRSPTTAVGLEVDVSWSYADSTANADDPDPTTLQTHSLRLHLRPTIKHYRPLHERVAPFMYGQVSVGFSGSKRDSDPHTQQGGSYGSIGIALGLGVEWFPFQRISLGGQTGLRLGYSYGQHDTRSNFILRSNRNWSLALSTFQSEVKALMYF
ncbi:MAG: hypothetical protein F4Y91_16245 [Gemmatimonadetes bacterium]|nr:hypothetical protein [Gemmatimonadota bacterium]MXY83562.1 hypothetical protein [Gemmatimonadota bacterium]MYB68590.1 hypothetical protein [Gemmatimonadota bacterium]